MSQQTAVEQLEEKLKTYLSWSSFLEEDFQQAKQVEKEQLNIARLDGINLANKGYSKKEDKTFKRKSLWTRIISKQL